MRISVNLASRPFLELRPLFARLRAAMAILALLAIVLGIGLRFISKHVGAREEQMRALQAQTTAIENQRTADENRMRLPENQAVLERSRFLNDVFQAKSFSWTAVMMDLENVLPAGVQVSSIEPVIMPDGGVNIRLRVTGDRDREVDLVRNLERSQRFVSPRLVNESAQAPEQGRAPAPVGSGAVEFDILSGYNPLPAQKAAAQNEQGAVPAADRTGDGAVPTGSSQPAGGPR
jgi:type IV pilus assembly protein PilN